MSEIRIPKYWVVIVLTLIGFGAGLLWMLPKLTARVQAAGQANNPQQKTQPAQPANTDELAQQAAVAGAREFYTINIQKGQQDWLDRLCSVSTQVGCTFDQNVLGPSLWADFEQAQTTTMVKVTPQEKVDEQTAATRGGAPVQIWRLQIELSDPWPMQKTLETVFSALALVVQEQDGWRFERFLTEEELTALSERGGQP